MHGVAPACAVLVQRWGHTHCLTSSAYHHGARTSEHTRVRRQHDSDRGGSKPVRNARQVMPPTSLQARALQCTLQCMQVSSRLQLRNTLPGRRVGM